jgi:two-component system, chemotaxis family, CheB/CheR fusion protein
VAKLTNQLETAASSAAGSAPEELETSQEELQSFNEKSQAVNHELKLKLETGSRADSDIQDLISATDVGTLFLGSDLRIRRFTPCVAGLFNISAGDEGRPISDFAHRLLNYRGLDHDARAVLANLSSIESEVQSDSGRWYLARMRPYRTIDDRIKGVVVTFIDITERRFAQRAVLESETRLQLARMATSLGIFDYDAEAGELWFDTRCRELWGLGETAEVNLEVFWAGIAESHRPEAQEALRRALDPDSDGTFSIEFRSSNPSKEQWLLAMGRAFLTESSPSRRSARLVGSIQDISATKAREAQQTLLLKELSHRVKNTLAVVNAVARQTLRGDTAPEALEKYEARLLALSDAHDLLAQSEWQDAEIGALVNRQLADYAGSNNGRIAITGPEFMLPAYLATPFAMLLHELVANAAKFGALGEHGNVAISWRVLLQRDEKLLEIVWKESGGPPVLAHKPPGFGTFFIENGLPNAKVERRLEAGGLICRIELPV